jgi:hypothetical protein
VRTTATDLLIVPGELILLLKAVRSYAQARPTRIGEFVSTSNRLKGQRDPTPVPSRPTRIGDNTSSSHHPEGQGIPTPEREIDKVHVTRARIPKKLTFQGHCFNGTRTPNRQQDDVQQGSPGRTIAPRVREKKRM